MPTLLAARAAAWTNNGDMPGVRGPSPIATVLRDGRVLVIGLGFDVPTHGVVEAAAQYDLTSGSWSPAAGPAMGVGSITLLGDGTVLAAGSGPSGRGVQRYNPITDEWLATGMLIFGRPAYSKTDERWAWQPAGQTATLLLDGRVLVAGGRKAPFGADAAVGSAEVYDPAGAQWTATGSMVHARADHTATLLRDGRVLVVGGATYRRDGSMSVLDSAEVYDPATGKWTVTGRLRQARVSQTATVLADGSVLVVGAASSPEDSISADVSTERYDPQTGRWTPGGDLEVPRRGQTATRLFDGNVLVAGGRTIDSNGGKPSATAELYEPLTDTWRGTTSMGELRDQHAAVLLRDGKVLVVGGEKDLLSMNWLASSELFDPGDLPPRP